jgi:hypothetical protein
MLTTLWLGEFAGAGVILLALAKVEGRAKPRSGWHTLSQIQGAERVPPAKEWRHARQHPAALGAHRSASVTAA